MVFVSISRIEHAAFMSTGWIGNWSPGIGDPTAGVWLTGAIYVWAAWVAVGVLQGEKVEGSC